MTYAELRDLHLRAQAGARIDDGKVLEVLTNTLRLVEELRERGARGRDCDRAAFGDLAEWV